MIPVAQQLPASIRTVAIDFPGHGQSPEPHTALNVADHIELIKSVLDQLGIKRFALVGHSNGGRISLQWASETSEPEFLVLIAPSGIRRKRTAAYYVRFWTARILKAPFQILPNPVRDFGLDWLRHSLIWKLLGSSDYRALSGVMRETFVLTVNHYLEHVLADISCPVLIYRGSADDAISHDQVLKLRDGLQDGGLYEFDGAGHYVQLEHADAIAGGVIKMMDA